MFRNFLYIKIYLFLIFDALIQRVFRVIPKIKNYKLVIIIGNNHSIFNFLFVPEKVDQEGEKIQRPVYLKKQKSILGEKSLFP